MTIPSRPAPPPPTNISNNNNIINNNNLSQFQQQQQRQHQNGGVVPKLTIKLPPPPTKGGTNRNYASTSSIYRSSSNNSLTTTTSNSSSITRKFPVANVRYAPTTNWDGSPFEPMGNGKKVPPPRPPPPKRPPAPKLNGYSTPPAQSVNILSNLFGRKKSTKVPGRSQRSGITNAQTGSLYGSSGQSHTNSLYSFPATTLAPPSSETNVQLISFDSPPSSPTFTQKSNSDCVSVDSFSSDSNFSSPNNGSVSQPESGFEDDFNASRATTSPLDPWDAFGNSGENTYSGANTVISGAPIRNYAIATARVQQNTDNPLCNGKSLLPPPPALSMPTIIKPKISQKPKAPKPPTLEQVRYNQAIGNLQQQQSQNNGDSTPPSPPMPNCPPPPPPPAGVSIIDVVSGRADASCLVTNGDASDGGRPYGIALYDFESDVEGDLSFRENEKIYILETLNDEWLRGRNRSGCEGIFPINYIDIKVPLNDNATSTTSSTAVSLSSSSYSKSYHEENKHTTNNQYTHSTRTTKTTTTATSTANYNPKQIRSLYTFDAGEPGDLIFQENDLITVLYRINEDWLFGETSDRRQGQFPANFLEYVPDNIPMP